MEKKSQLEKLIRTVIDDIKEDILKAKSENKFASTTTLVVNK